MTIARCRFPTCRDAVFNYKHRLCLRHYNRAKERRRLTKGALTFEEITNHPELLNGDHARIINVPSQNPAARSCFGCLNLATVKPLGAFACAKNQWGTTQYVSIDAVENGVISPHLVGRAKTCPFYLAKP